MRESWRLNKDFNILTSPAPPDITVCRSRSPGLLNRGPGGPASLDHLSHPVMPSLGFLLLSFTLLEFFSVSWCSFTGVWVTASLLKSPGLFLVFWPFSIMQSFGWSPLVRQLPSPFNNPLVTVPKALITIGIIVTFMFHSFFNSLARLRYLSFFPPSFSRDSKVENFANSLFLCWLL